MWCYLLVDFKQSVFQGLFIISPTVAGILTWARYSAGCYYFVWKFITSSRVRNEPVS